MKKLLAILFLCGIAAIHAAPVTLVENGVPKASIVIAEKPVKAAQLAAFELQHVVKLITGAVLPIVKDAPAPGTFPVYVGESAETIRRGMKTAGYSGEEYEVKFFPDALVLIGNDMPDFGKIIYDNQHSFPRTEMALHSTLYAAYDFLEKCCGVRFYFPGDIGTCFEPGKTLTVEPLNIRRKPSVEGIRFATLAYPWRIKPFSSPRDLELLRFRWRMATLYGQASHNTHGMYFRYWKKSTASKPAADVFIRERPELFAKGYEGRSVGSMPYVFPNDPDLPPNLCYTHPDTVKILADQAVRTARGEVIPWTAIQHAKKIKGLPYTYPMLGEDNNDYCKCENCRKLVPPGVTGADSWTWIYFQFINALCREVAKQDPDISIAAGVYQCPMQDVPLEKNMSLQLMFGINTWYLPVIRNRHMEIYNYWRKKAGDRPVTLWLYMLSPYWDMLQNNYPKKFFPGFYPNAVIPIIKMFIEDGVQGMFIENFVDYNYLETYLALNLCYDRNFPAGKELNNFYKNFFGAAAEPMREYWKEVESAFWNKDNYPKQVLNRYTGVLNIWTHTYEVNWGIGTAERVAKLDKLFKEAQKLAATPMEKARVEFLGTTIHSQMVAGRKDYENSRAALLHPIPRVVVPMTRAADGDPSKADFSRAVEIPAMKTVFGKDDATKVTFRLVHDFQYLYISMKEENPAEEKTKDKDEWKNNVEIFLAQKAGEFPYNHLVMSPHGTFNNYRHREVNGIVSNSITDVGGKYVSKYDGKNWSFLFAVPLSKLLPDKEIGEGGYFRMNLMRTRTGGENLSWSPLFDISYLGTLHRMGIAVLGGSRPRKGEINGDFQNYQRPYFNQKEWNFWSPVKDDPRVKLIPGKGLQLQGGEKSGLLFRSGVKTPAGDGNTAVIRLKASGKGTNLILFNFHENMPGDKTAAIYKEAIGTRRLEIPITEKEQEHVFRIPVSDTPKGKVSHVNFFLWPLKDAEMLVSSVSLEIE